MSALSVITEPAITNERENDAKIVTVQRAKSPPLFLNARYIKKKSLKSKENAAAFQQIHSSRIV